MSKTKCRTIWNVMLKLSRCSFCLWNGKFISLLSWSHIMSIISPWSGAACLCSVILQVFITTAHLKQIFFIQNLTKKIITILKVRDRTFFKVLWKWQHTIIFREPGRMPPKGLQGNICADPARITANFDRHFQRTR